MWCLPPLLAILWLLRQPWCKGMLGEAAINRALRRQLDTRHYHLLHNVTLRTDEGSTQIDHILVSVFGVFVIETKNMQGWIFGDRQQAQWTQQLYRHKSHFQNPLRQNYKHVKALQQVLELDMAHLHSVVVFTSAASFKTAMPDNVLCGTTALVRYIRSKQQRILEEAQVQDIYEQLQQQRLAPTLTTHRQHVRQLKARQRREPELRDAVAVPSEPSTNVGHPPLLAGCQRCGAELIERESKRGIHAGQRFLGCSRYPQCRYRQDLGGKAK
ncbi:NERD domain-containing protein [Pokkaliibacter sp. MBI-7]|uniref:nuclease-related domain-containing protein n=1 Tax=Pokkaliibacter sp. MBI-7 TaxID=3040600 RepID=UPI002449A539|nr:NERD domain-containing protein [Pokkaliibacter sp. MBI-7]MDH2432760.1 NERD domain-containing protein [Pokkaliibacter sp. MBI-7]